MYTRFSSYVYDCTTCPTRCDGVSKGNYNFKNDVAFSEHYEQLIIDRINRTGKYLASKSTGAGYPDITLQNKAQVVCKYVEIKVQQRTFMNVVKMLPAAGLTPSETVALNESDLVRYFSLEEKLQVPVVILWALKNRLCLVSNNAYQLYFQQLSELKKIHAAFGNARKFRRQSGEGDVVDGEHKGVTVNYHFSLNELKRWC